MGTIEQLEAKLWPYKMALIEAFGLDPEKTSTEISANTDGVTFRGFYAGTDIPDKALITGDSEAIHTVEFLSLHWTEPQRKAVSNYIRQFPTLGDFKAAL
jgi:hypothetical protein